MNIFIDLSKTRWIVAHRCKYIDCIIQILPLQFIQITMMIMHLDCPQIFVFVNIANFVKSNEFARILQYMSDLMDMMWIQNSLAALLVKPRNDVKNNNVAFHILHQSATNDFLSWIVVNISVVFIETFFHTQQHLWLIKFVMPEIRQ